MARFPLDGCCLSFCLVSHLHHHFLSCSFIFFHSLSCSFIFFDFLSFYHFLSFSHFSFFLVLVLFSFSFSFSFCGNSKNLRNFPFLSHADVALFTAYARKTTRAHRFTAYLPQPDGPANYQAWLYCWRVFRVACLMLKVAHVMPLDRYQRQIEKLATQWPTAWHLVCLAEDKCRFEHFNRLKSRIEFDISLGRAAPPMWDAGSPWSAIFLKAAEDDETCWEDNIRHPAMSWLAHGGRGSPKAERVVAEAALAGGMPALVRKRLGPRHLSLTEA